MKLYVDTAGKQVQVSRDPEPKADQNGNQKSEKGTGRLMWATQVFVLNETGGEVSPSPRAAEDPGLSPGWWGEVVLGTQVLGQRCEERIPAFVSDVSWFGLQEAGLRIGGLPAILLKKLPHKLPPHPLVHGHAQMLGERRQAHRLIPVHSAAVQPTGGGTSGRPTRILAPSGAL